MVNSFDPARAALLDPADRELLRRRDASMGAAYRLFYERPVHFVRGEGAFLYDADGADYLDAYNNVPVVGHSNPRVQKAVSDQLGAVNTHTRYLAGGVVDYAERLTALFPEPLNQAIFACTGSEAVDLALRIARMSTGRAGIIVTRHAYHGTTTLAAQISPSLGPNNLIPPEVALVDAPDSVRDAPGEAAALLAARIDAAVEELGSRGIAPAAIVVDSILSSDGLQSHPVGILGTVAERARAHGALYIADEVQPGFGRTGSTWWGFERHTVVPDLAVLGKPMGNGIPISAVVGSQELFEQFGRKVRYFNTFGGSAVSIAAATAVLDELESRELLPHSEELGGELLSAIQTMTRDEPGVAEVRGAGLFLAVEFVDRSGLPDAVRAAEVVNAMREKRILISASGTYDNVLKIRPPLVFPRASSSRLLEGLEASILQSRPGAGWV
ncbi:aspartate aminotransferase family protein [Arthrobacter sp. MYb23]|nr:aspartate aminotransferase family protein [Arthrobacter sp. MYb51]PRB98090.1 aspartate aminotransferase family protein [Arthrobacter sp. MYb23]